MSLQFAVLASGSRGNVSLVGAGGSGLLIDLGLGPKTIEKRLATIGSEWGRIRAAVLTHTHGDHVDTATLGRLASRGIPLYCHEGHLRELRRHETFSDLEAASLVRLFDERPFLTSEGLRVEPIELSHDGGPTFGFRFEGRAGRGTRPVAVGYLADTGIWSAAMADILTDVQLLGVEFNHDVDLQRKSGRSPRLIARNLGNRGHLSNAQGASLIEAVLLRSRSGTLRHAVLLHLSQQCNRPELAVEAARTVVRRLGRRIAIHAAEQGVASAHLWLESRRSRGPARPIQAELPF